MANKFEFHLTDVRSAIYCPRQAYYNFKQENRDLTPNPTNLVIKELAYVYPDIIEDPRTGLKQAVELSEADIKPEDAEIDIEKISENLEKTRSTNQFWEEITEPQYFERYVETGSLKGTINKTCRVDGNHVPSLVKTSRPPKDGVWKSDRIEATAVKRLAENEFEEVDQDVVVEYPLEGVLKTVSLRKDDEKKLDRVLEKLVDAKKGHPPSRTKNKKKCDACDFREECGVKTQSLLTKIKSLATGGGS